MRIATFLAGIVALLVVSAPARGEPWFDANESLLEDRYADGDFDEEDHVVLRMGGNASGAGDVHGESWLSLLGFFRALDGGRSDVGGGIVVGLALDRLAAGPVHRIADPPAPPKAPAPPVPPAPDGLLPTALADGCVAAALRASGLGVDDTRIDAIADRARASAALPETRLRAMRLWTDASHATTLATTDSTDFYAAVGANLILEARLTWRLDRLVYAGDEPTLERARLERIEARARLAEHALQALFAWARARLDAHAAPPGSREEAEAGLRVAEAEATLDVLTAGWFSAEEARRGAPR